MGLSPRLALPRPSFSPPQAAEQRAEAVEAQLREALKGARRDTANRGARGVLPSGSSRRALRRCPECRARLPIRTLACNHMPRPGTPVFL